MLVRFIIGYALFISSLVAAHLVHWFTGSLVHWSLVHYRCACLLVHWWMVAEKMDIINTLQLCSINCNWQNRQISSLVHWFISSLVDGGRKMGIINKLQLAKPLKISAIKFIELSTNELMNKRSDNELMNQNKIERFINHLSDFWFVRFASVNLNQQL
jgi:hypothetical protein